MALLFVSGGTTRLICLCHYLFVCVFFFFVSLLGCLFVCTSRQPFMCNNRNHTHCQRRQTRYLDFYHLIPEELFWDCFFLLLVGSICQPMGLNTNRKKKKNLTFLLIWKLRVKYTIRYSFKSKVIAFFNEWNETPKYNKKDICTKRDLLQNKQNADTTLLHSHKLMNIIVNVAVLLSQINVNHCVCPSSLQWPQSCKEHFIWLVYF